MIKDHPISKLVAQIEEQQLKIRDLEIEVLVLKDLLARTVAILAKVTNNVLPKGLRLLK